MQNNITSNVDEVVMQLNNLAHKGTNMETVFKVIANELQNSSEEAFDNEATPFGDKWQPLKESTLKAKKGTGKILWDSGRMKESITTSFNPYSATIGTNAQYKGYPYPAVHQFGSNNVPARPFLPFNQDGDISHDLKDNIVEIIRQHFLKDIK